MPDLVITKAADGKLAGADDRYERGYARFRAAVAAMQPGDTMRFSFWLPRSPKFHRRHFAMLGKLFESQEQFTDPEMFRAWVEVGAGFCDLLPGPKGRQVAVPRSIAWEKLDDADFAEHHADVVAFVRSQHFARFLWPHLDDMAAGEAVEAILTEFGA